MYKKILRKKLLNLRKLNYIDQSLDYKQFERILYKLNQKKKINIGGYYPINSEIGCLEILKKLENKKNYQISLPIARKNNNMDFYEWSFSEILKVSFQGIPEPLAIKKILPDGGGFYDRYISKLTKIKKVLTVGFAFSFQEIKKIPINTYDQKLDFILTNKGIVK